MLLVGVTVMVAVGSVGIIVGEWVLVAGQTVVVKKPVTALPGQLMGEIAQAAAAG